MNVKVFLAIAAAIAIIYGVAFVLIPDFLLASYGMTTEPSTVLSARYFGLTLLGLGLVVWLVRETSDGKALRGLLSGLAVQSVIGRGLDLGNPQRHHERNGLVGRAHLRCLARWLRLLPVR